MTRRRFKSKSPWPKAIRMVSMRLFAEDIEFFKAEADRRGISWNLLVRREVHLSRKRKGVLE
jgi:predicted DNA binding CopG/RHH family protein